MSQIKNINITIWLLSLALALRPLTQHQDLQHTLPSTFLNWRWHWISLFNNSCCVIICWSHWQHRRWILQHFNLHSITSSSCKNNSIWFSILSVIKNRQGINWVWLYLQATMLADLLTNASKHLLPISLSALNKILSECWVKKSNMVPSTWHSNPVQWQLSEHFSHKIIILSLCSSFIAGRSNSVLRAFYCICSYNSSDNASCFDY